MYGDAFCVSDLVIGLHILAVYSGALLALFTVAYCAYKFYRADERKNLARIHFSVLRFNPNILRDIFAPCASSLRRHLLRHHWSGLSTRLPRRGRGED